MTTTSVGETPGMPPNKIPFPPCVLLSNSEAIVMEAVPSISEITFSTGQRCLSSASSSYATAVIRLAIISSKASCEKVLNWTVENSAVRGFIIITSAVSGGSIFRMMSAWYTSADVATISAPASE